ncbi:MAG: AAA family ATPase [Chloroflexota bacterium]|nr:AAA family ATPase [Chloroflexota bacterium]
MLITSVELNNIKSYGHGGSPIRFRPGVNLICGQNGSGKSTLLEAIGFALFDSLDYNQAQLCREGESSGEVVLTFQSPVDERSYQVIRSAGKSTIYIYDPATKSKLVESKADTADWLSDHLGVDLDYARELFSNAIGVSQGRMTGSFLETPAARKTIFNPLLRVDEYERAWGKLRATGNHLQRQLDEANLQVAELRGELKRLPLLEAEVQERTIQITTDRAALEEATRRLRALQDEANVLQVAREQVEALKREYDEATRVLESLNERVQEAERELKAAEEATAIVAASEEGYQAYQEAAQRREELEAEREERDRKKEALQETAKKLSELRSTLERIKQELDGVAVAEARLEELAPLVEQQEQWEERRRKADEAVGTRQRALERVEEEAERLAELQDQHQTVRGQLEERERIEQQQADLKAERDRLVEELTALTDKVAPLEAQRERLRQELREAEKQEQAWELAKRQRDEAQAILAQLQEEIGRIEGQLEERARLDGILEEIARQIEAQQTEQSQAQALQTQMAENARVLQERLEMLRSTETATCPVCKEPLVAHRAEELEREFEAEQQTLNAQQQDAREAEQAAAKELKRLRKEEKKQQKARDQLPTPKRADEVRETILKQQDKVAKLEEQVSAVAEAPTVVAELEERLQGLEETVGALKEQQASLSEQRDEVESRREALNQELVRLPQPGRADELEQEIAEGEARREQFQRQADDLAGAAEQVERAKRALDELGDPRTERTRQQTIANRRGELEQEEQAKREEQRELETRRAAQEEALAAFASLDDDLVAVKVTLDSTKADHDRYVTNIKTAETRDTRQATVERLRQEHAQQRQLSAELSEKHEEAKAAYDDERHEQVTEELKATRDRKVALATKIESAESQLAGANEELSGLREQQKKLQEAECEVARLERLKEAFEFVREGIRKAGPAVVERRVQSISYQADQLFQEILGEPSYMLDWDESYEITVHCKGEQRAFKQLSGGEQMAAAIAVRLALLMQMSQIRTLFLDEPTTNLDDHRRDKLADRITQLDGLKQIFVITHDDSFERETHHVLRVRKENGLSRVEIGF